MSPYVEVAAFVPVRATYCYALPPGLGARARVGARVLVPFGARGVTGVIVGENAATPVDEVREIRSLLDESPALDAALVELCMWVADYYEAPPGEVLRAALPPGTAEGFAAKLGVSERGRDVLQGGAGGALAPEMRRALLALAGGAKTRLRGDLRAALLAAGLVEEGEERRGPRTRTRTVTFVRALRTATDEEAAGLRRTPARAAVLAALADGPKPLTDLSAAAVKALVTAGLVATEKRDIAAGPPIDLRALAAPASALAPTPDQAAALAEITAAQGFQAFLLHGVTGSGKTEVYLQAIAAARAADKGALVLVPEIALTPQLAARFRARFGEEVAVLHSGLADGERLAAWKRLRAGDARIALGARSAVFAPVADLGIVVVDEEHDPSFKQEEGVRYNARDVALVRAQRAAAVCVLGSATPSLESYANARDGRFRLLELHGRAHARPLPAVELVDLRTFQPEEGSLLTAPLADALAATLAAGDQAILFLNRRGFSTFVVCCACGYAFRCPHCSVAPTYHRAGERLRCHYCGHDRHVPMDCPRCHAAAIRRFGAGTERVEEALRQRYPTARIARLDRDTAGGRGLGRVLTQVARHEVDILVGTQMVTKGHDFPGVTLVGVLLADGALSLPDFRAAERTFQLLTQVAGRAGRGDRSGRVIIQTYAPEHHAIACARGHDFAGFFAAESAARAELAYPPHGRVIAVRLDGTVEAEVRATAAALAARAAELKSPVEVLGPAEAPLRRLRGRSRWHLWAKHPDRAVLRAFVRRLVEGASDGRVRVTVDVDPLAAL
jgi:primosomal protein N' (replication factor Y) (superfamily II helicase)